MPLFGAGVLFLALTAFSAVALAMLPFIPALSTPRCAGGGGASRIGRTPLAGAGIAALAAMFLFQAGNMGLGAFILARAPGGLGADFASDAVGYATWIGVLGAVLCVVLGTRIGRFWPPLAVRR